MLSTACVQRGTSEFLMRLLEGVAEAALNCAHRATTVSSWGLCEQEGHLAAPSQPSEVARCASMESTQLLPTLMAQQLHPQTPAHYPPPSYPSPSA